MKKTSLPALMGMNSCWLGLSFMWNSLHPIVLPAVLLHLVPTQAKNSYLGGLTFFGLLLAMFKGVFGKMGFVFISSAVLPPQSDSHQGLKWAKKARAVRGALQFFSQPSKCRATNASSVRCG